MDIILMVISSILIFGLAIWIAVNPFIGLYVFTVLLYIKPASFSMFLARMHITRLMVAYMVVVFLFYSARKKMKVNIFNHVQSRWFLTLIVMMMLSMTTSIWRGSTFSSLSAFLKVLIAYYLIVNLAGNLKRLRALIWAMVLSTTCIAVTSMHSYYSTGAVYTGARMFGALRGALFGDPNDMALSFIMLLPFLFYDLFRGKSAPRKIIQIGIIGTFFYSIILTQSRGGLVGLLFMFLVLWMKSRRKLIVAVLIGIVLFFSWQVAPEVYKERMRSITVANEEDAAAITRIDAWKAGFNMMKGRVFGVGLGNFGEGFVTYRPEGAIDLVGKRRVAHNMFIQVGGETGIPGLIVFVMLISSSLIGLKKVKKKSISDGTAQGKEIGFLADATFVSIVGFCASGMFLSQAYNWVLYYLIAFSVILNNQMQQGIMKNGANKQKD